MPCRLCQVRELLTHKTFKHFKPLVDEHGHMQGSAALQEVGRLLARELRRGEVGCRFGGDEFAWMLPDADGETASDRARALALAIEKHVFLQPEGISGTLSASFGCAAFPGDADTASDLLHCADQRMYEAKRRRHRERA